MPQRLRWYHVVPKAERDSAKLLSRPLEELADEDLGRLRGLLETVRKANPRGNPQRAEAAASAQAVEKEQARRRRVAAWAVSQTQGA